MRQSAPHQHVTIVIMVQLSKLALILLDIISSHGWKGRVQLAVGLRWLWLGSCLQGID